MKLSKALKSFEEEAQKSDLYWIEKAKLDFALDLEKQRQAVKLSYSGLAKKIGTSAAYITKIFRGDSNVTLESMVKLARATGGELDIQIINKAAQTTQWDIAQIKKSVELVTRVTTQSTNVYTFPEVVAVDASRWAKLAA